MRISVITAVYDRERTLPQTMASVLAQTHGDIEYIVVDGGSTDGTLGRIREFEVQVTATRAREFSFRWISEPDQGIYDAMNKGLRMATGGVVAILNSDDFYHRPDALARIAAAFDEDPELQIVYGDNVYVREPNLAKVVRYSAGSNYGAFTARCGIVPPHATFFARKENFEKFGYYDPSYRISGDCELELRFLSRHRLKSRYLPFDFVTMRLGGASTRGIQSVLTMQRECLRACRSNGLRSNAGLQLLRLLIKIPQMFMK